MTLRTFNPGKGPGSARATASGFRRRGPGSGIVVSAFHGGTHLHAGTERIRTHGGVRGGGNFSPMAPTELEFFIFDFSELLSPGEVINSVTWTNLVKSFIGASDLTPAARSLAAPQVSGAKVQQLIGNPVEGVTYRFRCVVITDSGQRFELYSDCRIKHGSVGAFSPALSSREVEWVGFEFGNLLAQGEMVINGAWDVSVKLGTHANPNAIKFGAIVLRESQVWQLINAQVAVPGTIYLFTCSANTSAGQTLALRRSAKVKE